MGERVLALVRTVHPLRICHRDLHLDNLIVDDNRQPLVIDLELACEVEPTWPCYDLGGPLAEVLVPRDHAAQVALGMPNGVWWDAALPSCLTSLGSVFGRIRDIADRLGPPVG